MLVLSTLTSPQDYTFYKQNGEDGINQVTDTIHINGMSNVASKDLITPHGVVTSLTDAQVEKLRTHPVFQTHVNNGFVKILMNSSSSAQEKAKDDMEKEDKSAPLTPKKYAKRGKKAPTSGTPKE